MKMFKDKCASLSVLVVSDKAKKFCNIFTSGLYYKSFMIVNYGCNVQFTIVMTETSVIKLRS